MPTEKSPTDKKPKHGRRADDGDKPKVQTGWGEDSQAQPEEKKPVYEQPANTDMETVDAGVDPEAEAEAEAARQMDAEELEREVAAAPVEYHTSMPKLAELESTNAANKWAPMAKKQSASDDIDLSALTGVLCATLDDEDAPWVPDLMLVQLTSELLVETTGDEDADGPSEPSTLQPSPSAGNAGPSPSASTLEKSGAQNASSANLTASTSQANAGSVSAGGRKRNV